MTVRRFLRHVGVGAMLAGLALAVAVVTLPPKATQMRFVQVERTVYVQADRGRLTMETVEGVPTVFSPGVPTRPKRAGGVREFLSNQFTTQSYLVVSPGFTSHDTQEGWTLLGIGFDRYQYFDTLQQPDPVWACHRYMVPAWLLALPGLIWISIRLRRKIINRSRPKGFDVLPGRDGV